MDHLPKCRWQTETLATIKRDDSDNIIIAYIGDDSTIVYGLWTPCGGREFWTKREINGVMYGQCGTEWPHDILHVESAFTQIRWMLTQDMCDVLSLSIGNSITPLMYTDCDDGDDVAIYVNVLTDIENIVRDCATVRAMESMVYSYEKVMA